MGEGFELICGDPPAFPAPYLFVRLAVGDRPVTNARGVVGPSVARLLEGENSHHEWVLRGEPGRGESVGEDEFLIRRDLKVNPTIRNP